MKKPLKTLSGKVKESAMNYRKLIGCRDYMRFLTGLCISRFGDGIDTIVFAMLIYQVTGSTLMMATLFAVNGLPNLIFGLLSGAVTSHKQEKYIMALCDMGRGLMTMLVIILCLTGMIRPWHFYVITFLNSSFEAFRSPAGTSIMPQLLPEEFMGEGIALQTTTSRLSDMIGLSIVPVLLLFTNLEGALFINALTFFACGLLTFSIRSSKTIVNKEEKVNYLKDILEGIKYMKGQTVILSILFFACFANVLFIPINVFQVPFVDTYPNSQTVILSVMNVMITIGVMVCTVVAPGITKKISEEKIFFLSGCGVSACYLCLSIASYMGSSLIWAAILVGLGAFTLGASTAIVNFIIMMKFYRYVSQEYMGRVTSIMSMFGMSILPIGSSLMGLILETITVRQLFVCSAIACVLVFGINYLFYVRQPKMV